MGQPSILQHRNHKGMAGRSCTGSHSGVSVVARTQGNGMSKCLHNHLDRLEGRFHPSGKDYVCRDCGEQLKAEPITITVKKGTQ